MTFQHARPEGKRKPCKWCRVPFVVQRPMQAVCGPKCAIEYAKARREKTEAKQRRHEKREGLERLMTRTDWIKKAQAVFNRWVRLRDANLPCISCGKFSTGSSRYSEGQWHAGHYRSTAAAPELRFDEDNCHKQCSKCNVQLSGNAIDYRIGLVKRLGFERVERLEGPHPPVKLTVADIQAIEAKYRALGNELAKALQEKVAA